ncbi:hypothetical protein LX32DRAFT_636642 [Colletotrichum zoysiae]|uniref:Uncharacterized protein n=1 Tax=Colletotrichum zoysiae TaxID=1216348 RepID=A0AAD9HN34_9PEZI|nr:hypothetical protein LX32DRAFT_636642 [Colletotrichum zoysiae]
MKFTLQSAVLALAFALQASAAAVEDPSMAAVRRNTLLMERQGVNANRPVANGACCIANTSLKQDVCNVNGQTGRCVPDGINNCEFPFRLLTSPLPKTPPRGKGKRMLGLRENIATDTSEQAAPS